MEIPWTVPQTEGIEVEETEIPPEEFESLFGDEPAASPASH